MNKSLIKFITDFGPLLIFFIFYKKYGMQEAILPLIIATTIAISFIYFYMKPTIINLMFAVALLYGKLILKTSLLKKVLGESLKLTDTGWNILTDRWIYFFIFIAILNELVWRTQSEDFWVQFKVFGMIPITIVYTFFQISVIEKYKIEE
jgi:intracellular septation protein